MGGMTPTRTRRTAPLCFRSRSSLRLWWCLFATAACTLATAAEQPAPVAQPAKQAAEPATAPLPVEEPTVTLSVEEITARIESVSRDESLADEVRSAVRDQYEKALAALKQTAIDREQTTGLKQAAVTAEQRRGEAEARSRSRLATTCSRSPPTRRSRSSRRPDARPRRCWPPPPRGSMPSRPRSLIGGRNRRHRRRTSPS